MDNRWWGVGYQVIPSKMFLSHSTEKARGVTLQCFRKILLRKNLWKSDGGYYFFPSKFFCITVPKNFVGEPFNVSEKLGFRKNVRIRRAYHYSPLNFLVSQCRHVSSEDPRVSENFPYRKISWLREGGI